MADVPDFWTRQYMAFVSAPVACLAFVAIGALAGWWLKGRVAEGQINGLQAQNAALNERLTLAGEKLTVVEGRLSEAKANVEELQQKIKANAPLALTTGLVGQTLSSLTAIGFANNDLRTSIASSPAHTVTPIGR
jgi:hypothetical protein